MLTTSGIISRTPFMQPNPLRSSKSSSRLLLISMLVVTPVGILAAQTATRPQSAPAQPAERQRGVKVDPWISFEPEYDSNVFLLSGSRKRAVDHPSSTDGATGRFENMESSQDLAIHAATGVRLGTRGIGGRAFTITPAIEYSHYVRNTERSHLTAGLGLRQALPRGLDLELSAAHTPSHFRKNFLLDAVDQNGDRTISPEERRYAPGMFADADIGAALGFRLRKSTKRSPLSARMKLGAGYYARSYDSPFEHRDLGGPTFGAALEVEPGKRFGLTLSYDAELQSADPSQEILILDEPDAGQDLDGNGRATDLNVRTAQMVDRSRRGHQARAQVKLDLPRRTTFTVEYAMRLRNFSSNEPLDLAHRDRKDRRNEVRAELSARVARGIRFTTGARFARQTTNRQFDPEQTNESEDYSRISAFAGLRYEF